MAINPKQNIQQNPRLHTGLNPFILTMSAELYLLNQRNTTVSKAIYLLLEVGVCSVKKLICYR